MPFISYEPLYLRPLEEIRLEGYIASNMEITENGVGYMFDRVSHTFFENKGTGAFKYSAVKADYIEVTSTPGLIDLELKYK